MSQPNSSVTSLMSARELRDHADDVVDHADGVLDRPRDQALHLERGRAVVGRAHGERGVGDVGQQIGRQVAERDQRRRPPRPRRR